MKRKNIAIGVLVLFLSMFLFVGAGSTAEVIRNEKKLPVYYVETDEKVVALTFDAAWGADKTRDIIELIKKYDFDATFFLVGFWIDKYEEETKLIADSGFEIGNHSNNHLNMSKLTMSEIKDEIDSVNERLYKLTGKKPTYFRPPFGDYNNKVIECVESLNMVAVQWSVDSLDWKGLSGDDIASRVLPKVKNGSIVLFHNNSDHIIEALKIILPKLKADGYKCVSIDELVMTKDYYIDNNGGQHKK